MPRHYFLFILFFCVLLYTQCNSPQEKTQASATPEMFDTFFGQFSRDSGFQQARTAFPLTVYVWDIDDTQTQKTIQKQEWKFEDFSKDSAAARRKIDAFSGEFHVKPPFHIYTRQGIDNGIHIDYYFEQKEGLWYLVKIEDKSI